MKRRLFIALGCLCVALGAVGTVLPVLPTTPFLLLATYLFARSLPRLNSALRRNRVFGKFLSSYFDNKPVPVLQKVVSIAFLWLGMGATIYFAALPAWVVGLLGGIGVAVSVHIALLGYFRRRKAFRPMKAGEATHKAATPLAPAAPFQALRQRPAAADFQA